MKIHAHFWKHFRCPWGRQSMEWNKNFETIVPLSFYMTSWLQFIKYIWAATWQNQQRGCAPSEDSDQPGHPPSLIRVFAVRMKKAWVLSYQLSAQLRLWSDLADAQANLSLRWAHTRFVGFVMTRLKIFKSYLFYLIHLFFLLKRNNMFSLLNVCNSYVTSVKRW